MNSRSRDAVGGIPRSMAGSRFAGGVIAALSGLAVAWWAVSVAAGWSPAVTGLLVLAPMAGALWLAARVAVHARAEGVSFSNRAEHARRLADQDALTGVGNYRAFWRALRAECARAERHAGEFTLAVIDLDDFKSVNDEHGHLVGDEILRVVAHALTGAVRAEDVLCRQGGDEFAVIAVAAGDREASPLAARLAAAVAAANVGTEIDWRPRASVGTATFGPASGTAEELMEATEASLAAAKSARHGGAGGSVPAMRPVGAGPTQSARPATTLRTLSSLARALTVARDERGVAETTVAHVAGAVDARSVAVIRRAGAGARPETMAFGGPPGAPPPAPGEDEAPLSVALRDRRAALSTPSPALEGSRLPEAEAPTSGTRLAAPIPVDDEVWGAILVETERDCAYDSADVTLVESMAIQLGRALSVSRLLDRLASAGWGEPGRAGEVPADEHGRAVAELSSQVGEAMGLSEGEVRDLHLAALFHELGTVCAPAGLIQKRGHLTAEEFDVVREHPRVGERLLGSLDGLAAAARIVRSERERYDGLGYPDGLAGEDIPLASRILGACDAFVAMTSRRPYRPPLSPAAAEAELSRGAGSQFDPDVVAALVKTISGAAVSSR